jgi:hypothetical protein
LLEKERFFVVIRVATSVLSSVTAREGTCMSVCRSLSLNFTWNMYYNSDHFPFSPVCAGQKPLRRLRATISQKRCLNSLNSSTQLVLHPHILRTEIRTFLVFNFFLDAEAVFVACAAPDST